MQPQKGYSDEIERLLKQGADIESTTNEGVTPLMFAVVNNQLSCVNLLLSKGADPNIVTAYYETPVLASVKNGNSQITESLIRKKADINVGDMRGVSPLHWASVNGNFTLTDMLLYYGAYVDKMTDDKTTPLMTAVLAGYPDVADLLLQSGANVNRQDEKGFSAYLIAAQNGDTLMLSLLKSYDADIYETNNYSYNALDIAIKENHLLTINYLLDQGNLWNTSVNDALNPLTIAVNYGRKEILNLLEEKKIVTKPPIKFDQVTISASAKAGSHDFFTGVGISVKEPLRNAGFILGCDFKPVASRLLIKESESLFYQYIDSRSVIYAGIFKELDLTDRSLKSYWSLSFALSGAYTVGNYFEGTRVGPTKKLNIIPSAYLNWKMNGIEVFGGIDYTKTEFYKVGPLWFRFGCGYRIFFDKVLAPGKTIRWY